MLVETKEIYKCEFCKKLYQKKNACATHEALCFKNPASQRACFSCVFLEKKTTTIYDDMTIGGERERNVDLLFCNKKEVFVYPPKVELKKNWFETGDTPNEAMPKECELRQTVVEQYFENRN